MARLSDAERKFSIAIQCLLAVFGGLVLGYDIHQVATGAVDMNRHMPVLLPMVFGAFIAIMRVADRLHAELQKRRESRERVAERL